MENRIRRSAAPGAARPPSKKHPGKANAKVDIISKPGNPAPKAPPSNPLEIRLADAQRSIESMMHRYAAPLVELRTMRKQIRLCRARLIAMDRQIPLLPFTVDYEQQLLNAAYELIDKAERYCGKRD